VPAADDGEATRLRVLRSLQAVRQTQRRRRTIRMVFFAACFLAASSVLAYYVARPRPGALAFRQPRVVTVAAGRAPVLPRAVLPEATIVEPDLSELTAKRPVRIGPNRRSQRRTEVLAKAAETEPVSTQASVPAGSAKPPSGQAASALYLTAQKLHFRGAPQAALAAWDAFLAASPTGPLAIEARYNRAVVLIRVGRRAEAREALLPFARGEHGGFRRADAALLVSQLAEP
jgi:hypothetical protein